MMPRLLLAALALAFSACTSTFDKAWTGADAARARVTVKGRKAVASDSFEGRWAGRWTSETHHAPFSKKPAGGNLLLVLAKHAPGKYRADIRAHWLAFRSDYQVVLDGRGSGRTLHLRGVQNASRIFGGPYRYDAIVTRDRFTMRYDSRYDRGEVSLTR